jgi:hypothetical protein
MFQIELMAGKIWRSIGRSNCLGGVLRIICTLDDCNKTTVLELGDEYHIVVSDKHLYRVSKVN